MKTKNIFTYIATAVISFAITAFAISCKKEEEADEGEPASDTLVLAVDANCGDESCM